MGAWSRLRRWCPTAGSLSPAADFPGGGISRSRGAVVFWFGGEKGQTVSIVVALVGFGVLGVYAVLGVR